MERISQLCRSLARDPTLRDVLSNGGVSAEEWNALLRAVVTGVDPAQLTALLDRIDQIADRVGLDGVATGIREYRPLPAGSVGYRSVDGWRCPHQHGCDRAEITETGAPACGLTGDPLTRVRVVSG